MLARWRSTVFSPHQGLGDLLAAVALGDQLDDLLLAGGQPCSGLGPISVAVDGAGKCTSATPRAGRAAGRRLAADAACRAGRGDWRGGRWGGGCVRRRLRRRPGRRAAGRRLAADAAVQRADRAARRGGRWGGDVYVTDAIGDVFELPVGGPQEGLPFSGLSGSVFGFGVAVRRGTCTSPTLSTIGRSSLRRLCRRARA